jgi:histidyl-tRNA synthetase
MLIACDAEGVFPTEAPPLDAYVIDLTGGESAVLLSTELRRAGFRVDRGFDDRSMKSQIKSADRSGALVALVIGPRELAEGNVTLRPLRNEEEQRIVPRADIVAELRALLF